MTRDSKIQSDSTRDLNVVPWQAAAAAQVVSNAESGLRATLSAALLGIATLLRRQPGDASQTPPPSPTGHPRPSFSLGVPRREVTQTLNPQVTNPSPLHADASSPNHDIAAPRAREALEEAMAGAGCPGLPAVSLPSSRR